MGTSREWLSPRKTAMTTTIVTTHFEKQASSFLNTTALIMGEETLDFKELNARANRLADYFRAQKVSTNAFIVTALSRSTDLLIATLAIWKARACYVPLDPNTPKERTATILEDCNPSFILVETELNKQRFEAQSVNSSKVINIKTLKLSSYSPNNMQDRYSNNDYAYLMYTSGSTGKPKGVITSHEGLWNFVSWLLETYPKKEESRFLFKSNISFDTHFRLWGFLLQGIPVVIAPPQTELDNAALVKLINKNNITHTDFVPYTLSLFLQEPTAKACESLTRVLCSGSKLSATTINKFFKHFPTAQLHDYYGLTEDSTDVTMQVYQDQVDEAQPVSIGTAIHNTIIDIIEDDGTPAAPGKEGEIHVLGSSVAIGYHNQPDLTAERFYEKESKCGLKVRGLKTGDIGYYLISNGKTLFYITGRKDDLVKISGVRVEPGEIENVLVSHPAVRQCAVVIADDTVYAFICVTHDYNELTLKNFAAGRLISVMQPKSFSVLSELPQLASGKINYNTLRQSLHSSKAIIPHNDNPKDRFFCYCCRNSWNPTPSTRS